MIPGSSLGIWNRIFCWTVRRLANWRAARRVHSAVLPSFNFLPVSQQQPSASLLGKSPVELTAREYALLEFLALHRGEVVTRTQLYEHLFDENESSLSNLLDVHVSNLRKKLGAEFITTRRGHGYCIEEK